MLFRTTRIFLLILFLHPISIFPQKIGLGGKFTLSQAITAFETLPFASYAIHPDLSDSVSVRIVSISASIRDKKVTYSNGTVRDFSERSLLAGLSINKILFIFGFYQRGDLYNTYGRKTDELGIPYDFYKDLYYQYQIDALYNHNLSNKLGFSFGIHISSFNNNYLKSENDLFGFSLSIGSVLNIFKNFDISFRISNIPVERLKFIQFNSFYFKGQPLYINKRLPVFIDFKLTYSLNKRFTSTLLIHNISSYFIKNSDLIKYSYKPGIFWLSNYNIFNTYYICGGYGVTEALTISGSSKINYKYLKRNIYWIGIEKNEGNIRPYISIIADDRNKPLKPILVNSKMEGQDYYIIGGFSVLF